MLGSLLLKMMVVREIDIMLHNLSAIKRGHGLTVVLLYIKRLSYFGRWEILGHKLKFESWYFANFDLRKIDAPLNWANSLASWSCPSRNQEKKFFPSWESAFWMWTDSWNQKEVLNLEWANLTYNFYAVFYMASEKIQVQTCLLRRKLICFWKNGEQYLCIHGDSYWCFWGIDWF